MTKSLTEDDLSPDELRQADLSHLHVSEMSAAQKAELRRRYEQFVKGLAKPKDNPGVAIKSPAPVKWAPRRIG